MVFVAMEFNNAMKIILIFNVMNKFVQIRSVFTIKIHSNPQFANFVRKMGDVIMGSVFVIVFLLNKMIKNLQFNTLSKIALK